jgi:hypothetical protein
MQASKTELELFFLKFKSYKIKIGLIFTIPCIVDYSIEILTQYSFVIEFIIPFTEGSTCFERHTAHHQEL